TPPRVGSNVLLFRGRSSLRFIVMLDGLSTARSETIGSSASGLKCRWSPPSDRRDGAAVNDILGSGDRCRTIRGKKGDQLSDLCRPAWTAQRDAAERFHQLITRRLRVGACTCRQSLDQGCCRSGLDEARGNTDDPDALWGNLVRQAFAVVAECRLRGGVGKGCLKQREAPLDR